MTDEQKAVASAYSELAKSPHATVVLDDLQAAINAFPLEHQAGAWRLYGFIQLRASALRRAKARGPVAPAKIR
jgi:hypothetical protein